MSTLRVTTISDTAGTGPVTLTKQEGVKARGQCDASGSSYLSGTFNVSSITDNGTSGKTFSLTNAFSTVPLYAAGVQHISHWGNNDGFINIAVDSSSSVQVRYYNGISYLDNFASFSAMGDLA